LSSVFSEECPVIREEDALTKWVSDPANTAWMESKYLAFCLADKMLGFRLCMNE